MRIVENKTVNLVLMAVVAVAYLAIYSFSTSPLYVNEGMDSCVFKTIGQGILNGKLPYVEIFDHKGPLLFYINALGLLISKDYGIIVLQTLNLIAFLFFLFKTANLYVSPRKSMLLALVALIFYSGLISEGNQCEEWMLTPIVVSLFWALRMIRGELSFTLLKSLMYGVFFGLLFFIRSNDAVSTVDALFFGLCLWAVIQGKARQVVMGILMFFIGFVVVSAPILILYCSRGAFDNLMYGLFGFNMKYTNGIMSMIKGVFNQKSDLLVLSVGSCAALLSSKSHKNLLFLYLPVLALFCVLSGNNCIPHYYIVTIPFFYGIVAVCLGQGKRTLAFVLLCLFLVPTYSYIRSRNRNMMKCMFSDGNDLVEEYYNNTAVLFDGIPEQERDSVWNYNLDYPSGRSYDRSPFSLLYHNGIIQCNRVVLCWHYGVDPDLRQTESITTHNPKWVVLNRDNAYRPDIEYIEQFYVFQGERESICVYRRKD